MSRVLRMALILPVFLFLLGGCSEKRKDEISTQMRELPKDGPKPVRLSRRQILEEVAAHRMTPESGAQLLDED